MNSGEVSSGRKAIFLNNRKMLIFSIIGICFKVFAGLGFSALMQKIIDTIAKEADYSLQYLLLFSFICVILLIIGGLLEYYCWTAFRSKALEQYKSYTYGDVLKKNIATFDEEDTATYISALSNDLALIMDNYIELIPYAAELIMNFIGTIVMMLYYNVKLSAIAFLISLLPLVFSSFRMKEVENSEEGLSNANSFFLGKFAEILRGFKTIKSAKAEKKIYAKLYESNHLASEAFSHREHVEISVAYIASIAGHVSQIMFFFIGMLLSQKDESVSVGIIIVFIQLMNNISQLGITMPELIAKMKSAKRLVEKNDRLLQTNKEIGKLCSLTCKKCIKLKELSYYFNDFSAGLTKVTCKIPANGCYAVIGESGSGKSTFLNLLSGINKDYEGEIYYDDVEISGIASESITELVSVVSQDIFIFNASIKDNITLFGLFDEQNLEQAIQKSGLKEIVENKGLEYICGAGGNALSGGERQRIGIARSIMQGTKVLLMDEATSALDTQTGYQIIETLQNMTEKTRIIITHDLYPTLMQKFDGIFVFKNGKLVEQGTFEELMINKGVCYELIKKN